MLLQSLLIDLVYEVSTMKTVEQEGVSCLTFKLVSVYTYVALYIIFLLTLISKCPHNTTILNDLWNWVFFIISAKIRKSIHCVELNSNATSWKTIRGLLLIRRRTAISILRFKKNKKKIDYHVFRFIVTWLTTISFGFGPCVVHK
jgi:hypothetical protein